MVEVPSWNACNFPPKKSIQYSPNTLEQIVSYQKSKNLNNSIFGHFDLMQWWKSKAREVSTPFPFEEITGRSKNPPVLAAKINKLKSNLGNNMPGSIKKVIHFF